MKNIRGQFYGEERIRRQQARVDKAEQEILKLLQDQAKGRRLSFKHAGRTMFDKPTYGGASLQDLYRTTNYALGHTLMGPLVQRLLKQGKVLYDENEECYKIGFTS